MSQKTNLKAIADAIRAKEGTTVAIPANTFAQRIAAIQTGKEPVFESLTADRVTVTNTEVTITASQNIGQLLGVGIVFFNNRISDSVMFPHYMPDDTPRFGLAMGSVNGSGRVSYSLANISGATVTALKTTYTQDFGGTFANGAICYIPA